MYYNRGNLTAKADIDKLRRLESQNWKRPNRSRLSWKRRLRNNDWIRLRNHRQKEEGGKENNYNYQEGRRKIIEMVHNEWVVQCINPFNKGRSQPNQRFRIVCNSIQNSEGDMCQIPETLGKRKVKSQNETVDIAQYGAREDSPGGQSNGWKASDIFILEIYGSWRAKTILEVQKVENWAIGTKRHNAQLPIKLKSEWVNLRSSERGNRV